MSESWDVKENKLSSLPSRGLQIWVMKEKEINRSKNWIKKGDLRLHIMDPKITPRFISQPTSM